ncbi:hypothetical protein MTR67_042276 [Solanum verrucosum]|uniref:Single-stranded DNA binding protein Ssb-like OB fold domain-containing protein n=1 Tax=Solanum verrucosum TaxID=315347 RepID=A0AAF0UP07_SOLVR|nr:hypothetical protein MTR67_042276 [Solanum verrucosum]
MASNSTESDAKPGLRKPVFVKVENLTPGTNGHTLIVKVLESNTVLQKGRSVSPHLRNTRIAECLIGDETGTILFTARNDQGDKQLMFFVEMVWFGVVRKIIRLTGGLATLVDLMKADATVILRNAKIDMFKSTMRLAVDKWGRIEVTEPAAFEVKQDNNLSLVEYELVNME